MLGLPGRRPIRTINQSHDVGNTPRRRYCLLFAVGKLEYYRIGQQEETNFKLEETFEPKRIFRSGSETRAARDSRTDKAGQKSEASQEREESKEEKRIRGKEEIF